MERLGGCRISGSFGDREIPLPSVSFYLFRQVETHAFNMCFCLKAPFFGADQCGRHSQVGSLAGAAHL